MNNFFVGVDLGGTRVKIGIVAGDKVTAHKIVPAYSASGLAGYLPVLQKEINALMAEQHLSAVGLKGIGIAFPGLVDTKTKKIVHTNKKYDDAPLLDLDKWTNDIWSAPCFIDNDARMALAGEWQFGAGQGSDDMVMMTIGTGIGTSAVIEGKLLRGKHFQAGVLGGHLSIAYEGEICICGNRGCAEVYGGSWNLQKTITQHPLYTGSLFSKTSAFDFSAVFEFAKQKDELAIIIMHQCMEAWAAAISNLIMAYDPELLILGGGVLKSADMILPFIRERLGKQAWSPWGTVEVRTSLLQEEAAILGVVYCLQHNK